jgi:putative copper resistance protein D
MSGASLPESLNLQLFQTVITQTPPGGVWVVRAIACVLFAAVLCFCRGRLRSLAGAALGAFIAGSLAWLGHAGATVGPQRPWKIAADVLHLLGAGLWPAGLVPFGLLLRRQLAAGAVEAAHAAVMRFSTMSFICVAVISATGFVNASYLVGSFHALLATAYGRLLCLKLLFFLAAVCLGAWNRFIHKPQFEIDPAAPRAIVRKIWLEAFLGAFIVLVVAILGLLPPGAEAG